MTLWERWLWRWKLWKKYVPCVDGYDAARRGIITWKEFGIENDFYNAYARYWRRKWGMSEL
jgi:hypothetical protein